MFRRIAILGSIAALATGLQAPTLAGPPKSGTGAVSIFAPVGTDGIRPACEPTCDACDDGLECTTDNCDVCSHIIDVGYCVIDGACVAAGSVSPDNPCRACNPAVSQTAYTPTAGSCEDGSACTTYDTCVAGSCVGGPAPHCNDYDKCTVDSCDPSTGCLNEPKDCSDGISCNIDSCTSATGACTHSKQGTRVAYIGPSVALRGRPIVLSAALTESGGGPAAAGRAVTFRVVTQICIGTTDTNGVARCTIVVNQTPGAKSISLSFAGDASCYLAASRSDVLWVQ